MILVGQYDSPLTRRVAISLSVLGIPFEQEVFVRTIQIHQYFGGAFEDVENAGVAENARYRKFKRKAVAAVDLQGIVGRGPGDARGEKFCHAGFEVAAPPGILLPRGVIGELPRDHDLDRHHGELVRHPREIRDRLTELHACGGVA